jgi:hypothetical protein
MGSNIDQFSQGMLDMANEMLALTETPRLVAEKAAPKLRELIIEEFDQGTDPSGAPWAPLKGKAAGRSPLVLTGRTRDSTRVVPLGTKVYGKLGGYMNIHQNSKGREPQRKAVMRGELTGKWREALEESAREALAELAPKLSEGGGITKK